MKFRNREINIFSMSALDLFASALGAFILIAIVLMPYYLRMDPDAVQELQSALAEAQTELNEARAAMVEMAQQSEEARQCTSALEQCELVQSRTVLIVAVTWPGWWQDVDLHVVDPSGMRFSFETRAYAGHPGELSLDSENGPGAEIWHVIDALPGEYELYYSAYSWGVDRVGVPQEGPALVKGSVFHRNGMVQLRERTLHEISRWPDAILAARVTVTEEGEVIVNET